MSSILKIKSLKDSYTTSERKIAEYILNNTEDVLKMTTDILSDVTDTSPASIVRFSKKMGYLGFQDLKIALARDLMENTFDESKMYSSITLRDSMEEIVEKIAVENINIIKDTIKMLDLKSVKEAAIALANADGINIFGAGTSHTVALDLQYRMIKRKIPVNTFLDPKLQLHSAANMKSTQVAVAISNNGRTETTYNALKTAKEAGAITISITKYGKSPISQLADINIFTVGIDNELKMGSIPLKISQLTAIDILFIAVLKEKLDRDIEQ